MIWKADSDDWRTGCRVKNRQDSAAGNGRRCSNAGYNLIRAGAENCRYRITAIEQNIADGNRRIEENRVVNRRPAIDIDDGNGRKT